jgi:hypothetical protein
MNPLMGIFLRRKNVKIKSNRKKLQKRRKFFSFQSDEKKYLIGSIDIEDESILFDDVDLIEDFKIYWYDVKSTEKNDYEHLILDNLKNMIYEEPDELRYWFHDIKPGLYELNIGTEELSDEFLIYFDSVKEIK